MKNDPFADFDKNFNRGFKLFWVFFAFVFVMIIGGWVFSAYFAVKTLNAVEKDGLKSVVERVWEGEKK